MEAMLGCSSSIASSCCDHRAGVCTTAGLELRSSFTPRLSSLSSCHGFGISSTSKNNTCLLVVRAGKGKRRVGTGVPQQQRIPSFPKLEDDGNPKFVIFVRDKKLPLWFPLNIISGGSVAKVVVAAMGNEWGRKMAQSTLTRDLGNALYKDEKTIRMSAIKTHPMLKNAKELEYGYKLVNMEDQRSAFMPSNVTKIPPKEELKSVVEKVKDSFGDSMGSLKDAFNFGQQESSGNPTDSK